MKCGNCKNWEAKSEHDNRMAELGIRAQWKIFGLITQSSTSAIIRDGHHLAPKLIYTHEGYKLGIVSLINL